MTTTNEKAEAAVTQAAATTDSDGIEHKVDTIEKDQKVTATPTPTPTRAKVVKHKVTSYDSTDNPETHMHSAKGLPKFCLKPEIEKGK